MRRVLLVLTVAALMAAMLVGAGPAKAKVSIGNNEGTGGSTNGISNSFVFVQSNDKAGDIGDDDIDDIRHVDNDGISVSFGGTTINR